MASDHPNAADLEVRAATLADPGIDLKGKLLAAVEIRDFLDTLRDAESSRILPQMIPSLIDLLRAGQPQFKKDSPEYRFRRVLVEIIHRMPYTLEPVKNQCSTLFSCLVNVIRHDNEEIGTLCSKSMLEIVRTMKVTEDILRDFFGLIQEMFANTSVVVAEYLSADSPPLDTAATPAPAIRSFKVLGELSSVLTVSSNSQRPVVIPLILDIIPTVLDFMAAQSPVQSQAREDFEAMGDFWCGMALSMKNPQLYHELIAAQVKFVQFVPYVLRFIPDPTDPNIAERLTSSALRIFQDCPTTSVSARKELVVVFRHFLTSSYRAALLPHIDKLFDERVLLGTGTTSRELLRPNVYGAVADLIHHLRNELSPEQITRIIHVYSRLLQNPSFSSNLHSLFAKMLFGLVEVVVVKQQPPTASRVLGILLETCVQRLEALTLVQQEVNAVLENTKKGGPEIFGAVFIERTRPIGGSVYATEKPEEVLSESKHMFRTLLHGFRVCLGGLRKCSEGRPMDLDGTLIFRLFDASIRCFDLEIDHTRLQEPNDPIDWFAPVLHEINLHIFQEVWTHKIDAFFQVYLKRPALLSIAQTLFNREACSPTLLAIVLRYLVDRLSLLGEQDEQTAMMTVRLFKIAFGAVSIHPAPNEPILASFLGRLLTDCFSLAARATKPMHYFILLRTLFRSIGGGGGRFELLYPEVLPLLPEMLESLNRQLLASEGVIRDTIVELCLTVPLRLTHLLPHLTYLMHPLALSLRGGHDLVAQGLRTLELFIDNLTPDFLDPTLNTVARELMEALHSHLQPVPSNHHHAHTTIRILGKLGGRNRKLLAQEPALKYHESSVPATVTITFGANATPVDLAPTSILASRVISKGAAYGKADAYDYLESCLSIIIHEGIKGRESEDLFVRALDAIFDAIHIADTQEKATAYARQLSRAVFDHQIQTKVENVPGPRPYASCTALLARFLDALPRVLAREDAEQAKKGEAFVMLILQDLVESANRGQVTVTEIFPTLNYMAQRFSALCLEDTWMRKSAGCNGIKIMTYIPEFGDKWILARELEITRTLLHILKDLPSDLPRDTENVVEVMKRVLTISNASDKTSDVTQRMTKFFNMAGIFSPELQSPNPAVRAAAHTGIALLSKLSGRSSLELLMPQKDRVLNAIYTKPLRALPFTIQIGMIEAIRYCMELGPPLIELNDELLRLLHETLALADAEDANLLPRVVMRQSSLEVVKLRVACIKLLTASMPLTEFFARQNQTRQKVISVYFKSLYSMSLEVKNVAHEGLAMVLLHQSRLPKELLQTGLRPILMNLADPKRLSIPGLEGLARLLELLTNYFKVEIGHKLLDHFRIVADPQMLLSSSRTPLAENEGITKLVRLANIFHLLPSAANIFLESLVNAVVQTETTMHFSSRSPFSEPLAKYLDRYPVDGADFLLRHLNYPRYLRTLRSILQAKLAPNLLREFSSRTTLIVHACLKGTDPTLIIPALYLFTDLAELVPYWMQDNKYAIEAIVELWWSPGFLQEHATVRQDATQRHSIVLPLLFKVLQCSPRIDLLFDVVAVFTRDLAIDSVHISHFLYNHVALSDNIFFRRNILMRFLTWFDNPVVTWAHKAACIRYIITPMLLVHAKRFSHERKYALLDNVFVDKLNRGVWAPVANATYPDTDDAIKIEIIHLTAVLVEHYSSLAEQYKKDIIKGAWLFIDNSEDAIVKQTAFLLAAKFYGAYPAPPKHILKTWMGLLRPPHMEGKPQLRSEALAVLAQSLPDYCDPSEPNGPPAWAKTTRRLLSEEGSMQLMTVYHLMTKMPDLFYPVRSLFVPHMVNSLTKLGLSPASGMDARLLSIEVLKVVFEWDQKAAAESTEASPQWRTGLGFRESIVSYIVRMASMTTETPARIHLIPRALGLLQRVVGTNGWSDVTVGLRYFLKSLEVNDLNTEQNISLALVMARVLQVVVADQDDAWYTSNSGMLAKLVKKGMNTDDSNLHDALHVIFERLVTLYPLPKEEEVKTRTGDIAEFHAFIYTAIGEGLRNTNTLRGTLLMLKAVVQVDPERIETFAGPLIKLLSKLAKDHCMTPPTAAMENIARLIQTILDICQISITSLADQRKWLMISLNVLVSQSKSLSLCRYILDMARNWVMGKQDTAPSMKDKASLLQKMATYEARSEGLFNAYLELVYEIYTEFSLRRSELTLRLEPSFLLGCRARDPVLRGRFMDLFDATIPRSLYGRLTYILGVQSWEALQSDNWIYLALHLLLGSVNVEAALVPGALGHSMPRKLETILRPMQRLCYMDKQAASDTWISVFPAAWACLSRREQVDVTFHMTQLLSKEYHIKQAEVRPNVIQTLLTGVYACSPPMSLPPHLVKYLAKTYGAWHVSMEILSASLDLVRDDDRTTRDYVQDSLADVYAELSEEDLFYGLWRKRCLHTDTNIALAFEQNGMWDYAEAAYETAQSKSRQGTIPFSESEFCLWEDHWVLAAEKLQHWDILYELAKSDGNQELMLESAWRTKDWAESRETLEEQIRQLPEVPTPRRRVFEAFIALLKMPGGMDKNIEFTKLLDDAMQLSLRKWVSLPPNLSTAHVPILQHFQQFVELQEAVQIFGSLAATNAQNLEKKSSELKMVLQAWRERLPNVHDDISIWSDLVAWRQNVFGAINKAYLPLIATNQGGATTSSTNTFGYRGYHETAWIINRFAHVARKHDLLDVCFSSLNKIYTLPNIEISEAFLKLREQARCHYQKPNDLHAGLEVINNTNLIYFTTSQKAEFYTLKGMFHARFGRNDDANTAFGQAVQLDMGQAKAWAEWGRYNDRMFKESPTDMTRAASAVSCYLQAAGVYKNGKSRPLLARILWLLSVDDANLTISRAFDTYKGDAAYWFWITLIPQLCQAISHREVKQARYILLSLAKLYPQALFYQLRTTQSEMLNMKKAAQQRAQAAQAAAAANATGASTDVVMGDAAAVSEAKKDEPMPMATGNGQPAMPVPAEPPTRSHPQPWETIEEVVQILKTAFPLLILSMENMMDQLIVRFKHTQDEEIYKHICLLMQDGLAQYIVRANNTDDDLRIQDNVVAHIIRLAKALYPPAQKEFHEDFSVETIQTKPRMTMLDYFRRLQRWRQKYDKLLQSRPRFQSLDGISHYLTEFQYSKVDEIEVPGQYTEDKLNNQNFVRILKFCPKVENCLSNGVSSKRITIRGNDNSRTAFVVQLPPRFYRREDRVTQVFRTFNGALSRKKESRKRNLTFHLPACISCSTSMRLYQADSSYVSFGDIFDQYCAESNMSKEDPIFTSGEKMKQFMAEYKRTQQKQMSRPEYFTLKKEIFDETVAKLVPEDIISRYMMQTMEGPSELWRMRKEFALQTAANCFMTYAFCLHQRSPHRFLLSRSTGQIAVTDITPGVSPVEALYLSPDVVPFRLTPNMQHFIGPILTEGVLTSGIMTIGRCLSEPEFDLDSQLCLHSRDEVVAWLQSRQQSFNVDLPFRQAVSAHVEDIVKRVETMSCKIERDHASINPGAQNQPVVQTVTNLVSQATNPTQLAKMGEIFYPWF